MALLKIKDTGGNWQPQGNVGVFGSGGGFVNAPVCTIVGDGSSSFISGNVEWEPGLYLIHFERGAITAPSGTVTLTIRIGCNDAYTGFICCTLTYSANPTWTNARADIPVAVFSKDNKLVGVPLPASGHLVTPLSEAIGIQSSDPAVVMGRISYQKVAMYVTASGVTIDQSAKLEVYKIG